MHFKKTTLQNGLRCITIPMADNPAVTVLVMVEAGSKYEAKAANGISHFLEHMIFKGTPTRPKAIDISRELDSIGAQYNAFTSQEYTGYYAKADARHLDICLDVVSDMYNHPLFDAAEIAKEKGVIVEEIRMYQDMPQRHVQDLFLELLYGDQPAGWNIAGSEATVKSFSREDFLKYRGEHYVASATTVVVAGNLGGGNGGVGGKQDAVSVASAEKNLIEKIEKKFADISAGKKHTKVAVKEIQKKPAILAKFKETDQTHLVIGVRSFPILDPRTPALRFLATILGGGMSSRLFQKLRDEMGVGYYVRAENDPYTDHGIFAVSTGVDNARVDEVVKAIIGELKKFIVGKVGDATATVAAANRAIPAKELRKAKDYLIGSMMLSLETSDARAEFCSYQEILKRNIQSPAEVAEEIEKVTAEEICAVAREIFTDERLNLAVIGRYKDGEHFRQILTFK
jgi:predicted Zn-dependent peptidase